MQVARQRQLSGASASADGVCGLDNQHRSTGLCHRNGGGQAVRPGADDDRVIGVALGLACQLGQTWTAGNHTEGLVRRVVVCNRPAKCLHYGTIHVPSRPCAGSRRPQKSG